MMRKRYPVKRGRGGVRRLSDLMSDSSSSSGDDAESTFSKHSREDDYNDDRKMKTSSKTKPKKKTTNVDIDFFDFDSQDDDDDDDDINESYDQSQHEFSPLMTQPPSQLMMLTEQQKKIKESLLQAQTQTKDVIPKVEKPKNNTIPPIIRNTDHSNNNIMIESGDMIQKSMEKDKDILHKPKSIQESPALITSTSTAEIEKSKPRDLKERKEIDISSSLIVSTVSSKSNIAKESSSSSATACLQLQNTSEQVHSKQLYKEKRHIKDPESITVPATALVRTTAISQKKSMTPTEPKKRKKNESTITVGKSSEQEQPDKKKSRIEAPESLSTLATPEKSEIQETKKTTKPKTKVSKKKTSSSDEPTFESIEVKQHNSNVNNNKTITTVSQSVPPVAVTPVTKTKAKKTPKKKKNATSATKSKTNTIQNTTTVTSTKKLPPVTPSPSQTKKNTVKKKKKTLEEKILHQMLISMKPFSLRTLSNHTDQDEDQLQFIILSLLDKNLVCKKEFPTKRTNKILYWANPQEGTAATKIFNELASPQKMQETCETLENLRKEYKMKQNEISQVLKIPSNGDIDVEIDKIEKEIAKITQDKYELENRIKKHNNEQQSQQKRKKPIRILPTYMSPGVSSYIKPKITFTSPSDGKIAINFMRSEWKTRKDKCMDFLDRIADAMEKTMKDVCKLLDVESDEQAKVTLPEKYVI